MTGLITPGGDSGALAVAIRELLADRERRERMGAAGRAWVCANFSFAQIAREFEALLGEDAAGEQRLAAPE